MGTPGSKQEGPNTEGPGKETVEGALEGGPLADVPPEVEAIEQNGEDDDIEDFDDEW